MPHHDGGLIGLSAATTNMVNDRKRAARTAGEPTEYLIRDILIKNAYAIPKHVPLLVKEQGQNEQLWFQCTHDNLDDSVSTIKCRRLGLLSGHKVHDDIS